MSKEDEAKPVVTDYDFSDDEFNDEWLKEIDDVFDFDIQTSKSDTEHVASEEIPIEVDLGNSPSGEHSEFEGSDIKSEGESADTSDGLEISIDVEPESENGSEKQNPLTGVVAAGRAVRTQTLDIAMLQKHAEASSHQNRESRELNHGDPLKDEQLWQFVSLIVMRLFDDLELLVVQKHCEEACDLMKQLHRLANILSFAGMGEQLPLIAYISNMLPVTFSDAEIGLTGERKFDPLKMREFTAHSNEFLNCLVYLLTYFTEHGKSFDSRRFSGNLETLYNALSATPGQPSVDAPLPVSDNINPQELTTRTVNKLARTIEALVTESLHYVESGVFYGYSNGYEDAAKSLDNASQLAHEYQLQDMEQVFAGLCQTMKQISFPAMPGKDVYESYFKICDLLESHFSKSILEKKIKHLRALISKFMDSSNQEQSNLIPFGTRWHSFVKATAPILDFEYASFDILREKLQSLTEIAQQNQITWLSETFRNLDIYWETYPDSCAEAFIALADELRAFPTEDIEAQDIEQLNHERLKVLFSRTPGAKIPSSYSVIQHASEEAENILQLLDNPTEISSAKIQDLLIDARCIRCHALIRSCEILLTLLERVPAPREGAPVVVAESVINAIYFTAGFMQSICESLKLHLEHNSKSPATTSSQIFYMALIDMYAPSGQLKDGIVYFIIRRLNQMLSELQLVWANSSTPTSTEYYCSLVRKLMHLVTVCELKDVRRLIIRHLDEIPQQDFINTENQTMQRQCLRIIRAVEENCPKLSMTANSNQVRLFFTKTIAALNQLLSSRDANDPEWLRSEISRIETRMSVLGMTTDFPPVIASIYELHHFAYKCEIVRSNVEDLLYNMLEVANNICPEWVQPKSAELEFIKTAMPMPMDTFQRMYESIGILHQILESRANEEPLAWEQVSTLYNASRKIVNYPPYALYQVVQNAQNRCRYLKKNIYFELNTDDYPPENELPNDPVRPAVSIAFSTIIDKLLEIIVDNAFTSTDDSSRVSIALQPFANEFSTSISHNGKLFTCAEITEKLSKVNIMPAMDDNLFDLLASSRRLALSYPPVNAISYILPLLRQFNGRLDISDDHHGNTRFYLSFKL